MTLKAYISSYVLLIIFLFGCSEQKEFKNFITRDGSILKDGDSTYRFLSFNIPNINFVEDEMEFTKIHPFRLPTSFEIRDAFESVKLMGGTVVRAYTFPVKRLSDTLDIPRYVTGIGEFDENSFKVMDTVLALANETNIRLILPLLNNWKWMGGVPQYTQFRNKTVEEFWTDSLLIADFKLTINYILNRKNTVTNVLYKNDKSILCWETGNELISPYSWVKEIVGYIKSIDSNHLVMDGFHAIDGVDILEGSLNDTLVDIVSTHHYKLNPFEIVSDIDSQLTRINNRKPYIVGEFGFLGTGAIEQISEFIISKKNITGGLIWSLRSHREKGGFFWHDEPHGGDLYKAFHFPGFISGVDYNEEEYMKMFRSKAYEIRNLKQPKIEIPKAPVLLPIITNSGISWKGSAGARYYDLQRSESNNGPWETVGYNISDAKQYYRPLFNDDSAEMGKSYYYKVIAKNISGQSPSSNIIGPVKVLSKKFIDEFQNLTAIYYSEGNVELKTNNERVFKEDPHRAQVTKGARLYYFVPGKIISFDIFSFSQLDISSLKFGLSDNREKFESIKHVRKSYFLGKGDYNYWVPSQYQYSESDSTKNNKYLKIEVEDLNQISRIEIEFVPN